MEEEEDSIFFVYKIYKPLFLTRYLQSLSQCSRVLILYTGGTIGMKTVNGGGGGFLNYEIKLLCELERK